MSFLHRPEVRAAAYDALALLRKDPRRLKALMRSVAALVEELSVVLVDAAHDEEAKKLRRLSRALRAAAILPAAASTALARKLLDKAVAAED